MSNPAADEMVELLTRELATLDQLKQVLDNESDALLKNDINAVEGSAHHKKSLLARFQKRSKLVWAIFPRMVSNRPNKALSPI
jgi:flagellar biosynthesis/type III secretory pathway chaperone